MGLRLEPHNVIGHQGTSLPRWSHRDLRESRSRLADRGVVDQNVDRLAGKPAGEAGIPVKLPSRGPERERALETVVSYFPC